MNLNRLTMLGFAAIATAAHAETYFFANSISFTDVTTVNGVPTFAGSQSGQPMRLIGTNPAGVEIVTGGNYTNFGGSWKISADGTKMNGNVFGTGTFGDGNAHSTMGRYDFTTSSWSEYGSNGFYTTVAPNEASNSWGISGDGSTVIGQSYYNTTGGTGTRVNPVASRSSGTTTFNLFPNTSGSGRTTCSNYDGTVVGGYVSSTATGSYYVWNGSGYGAGNALAAVFNGNNVNLGAPQDISADGTYLTGNGASSGQRQYIYNRFTGEADYVPNPFTNFHRANATGISYAGDIVCGYWVDFSQSTNLALNIGYIWSRELGHVKLNDYIDANGMGRIGVNGNTINLIRAFSISPDGEWVVGFGLGTSATESFAVHLGTALRGDIATPDFTGDITTQDFVFTLKDSSGTVVDSWTQKLSKKGHFLRLSQANLGSGDHTLTVKGTHWLAKSLVVNPGTKSDLDFTAINGDCDADADNKIDLGDYLALSSAFDSAPSDSNWNPMCDLDGSGQVELNDYLILVGNFDMVGDN